MKNMKLNKLISKITATAVIIAATFSFTVVDVSASDNYGYYGYDDSYGEYAYDNDYGYYGYDDSYGEYAYDNDYGYYGYDDYGYYGDDDSYGEYAYDNDYGYYGYDDYGYYGDEYDYGYGGYDYDYGYEWDYNYGGYDYCYDCNDYDYGYEWDYNYGYYEYDWNSDYDYDRPNRPNRPESDRDIEVSCDVSDRTIEVGESTTLSARIFGGDGPIDFDWSGDTNDVDGFDEDDISQRIEFDEEGVYEFIITAEDDDGDTDSETCTIRVEEEEDEEDDFGVQCEISDYSVEEGDFVTVRVGIRGGDTPFDIEWDGDIDSFDGFDDNSRSQRVRIDNDNDIELEVEVEDDDGNIARDTCRTIRVDEEDNDNNINVITSTNDGPDGDLAGLQSVFLNQVPYTGPVEDAWKVLSFVMTLLALSTVVGYVYYKKRQKLAFSNSIQSFKEQNRLNN
jgi:hypothetical protein